MRRSSKWQVSLLRKMRLSRARVQWSQMKGKANTGMTQRCLIMTTREMKVFGLGGQKRGLNRSAWPLVPGLRLQAALFLQRQWSADCSRVLLLMQSCRLHPLRDSSKGAFACLTADMLN